MALPFCLCVCLPFMERCPALVTAVRDLDLLSIPHYIAVRFHWKIIYMGILFLSLLRQLFPSLSYVFSKAFHNLPLNWVLIQHLWLLCNMFWTKKTFPSKPQILWTAPSKFPTDSSFLSFSCFLLSAGVELLHFSVKTKEDKPEYTELYWGLTVGYLRHCLLFCTGTRRIVREL